MLSKIANLFTKTQPQEPSTLEQTFDHSKITSTDSSQCPFMQKKNEKSTTPSTTQSKCPISGKESQKNVAESDSQEEEKPRGGCPFMGGSDKKKNPSLGVSNEGFNEPFVSKYKYYLSANKLDFSMLKKNKLPQTNREVFDQYPVYLQHTLFFSGQDYKKVRGLECCSRFMAYQQLREKGNKYFNKGKYYQALDYYERAMSLFRWLQYHQNLNETKLSSEVIASEQSIDESDSHEANGSKINIEIGQQKAQEGPSPFDDLKDKYKEFFITYSDDNVKEFDGEDMQETADIDMRKSLLVQVYLNMAAAYMNLNHFQLAEKIINDGFKLSDRVSQLYFRKAQSLGLRKDSSVEQLQLAKTLINKALQLKPNEKIFSTANANILKMLNLHDAEQCYHACAQKIDEKLNEAVTKAQELKTQIYNRAKQINQIEKRMIQEGKTPRQNLDEKALYDTTEMKILERMLKKYARVVEFYTQAKNPEQVNLAKKQFQQILRIWHEVRQLLSTNIEQVGDQLGGLESDKIQKRVNLIKTRFAEDIYNKGRFNFTMLQWVIKEIVKQQGQEEKRRKEQQAELNPQTVQQTSKKGYGNFAYLLLLIPLLFILVNFFVL